MTAIALPLGGRAFLSDTRLATLQKRVHAQVEPTYAAFLQLQRQAQSDLGRQPHAPAVWYVPGYYRDAEGHRSGKRGLEEDANSAYALALFYRLTGLERAAATALSLINAWATQVQTLRTEDDSRLSFSYHFPALILAADLLARDSAWPSSQQDAFRAFVRQRAIAMNTMERANNWGNWGVVLVMASAALLGDRDLFTRAVARWQEFIETQIAADGHLPHEVGRNNGIGERGIWYSHFTLMPQTLAAEIARLQGVDLYDYRSPGGKTLRLAFERLAPWALQPETFPYFRGGVGHEQRSTDYISYFEILNARWPQAAATAMVERMRPLTATHCTPYLTLTHGGLLLDEG